MNWITDTIAIGNREEAQDSALLRSESIGSILSLVPDLKGIEPEALGVQQIEVIPLIDGPGNDPRLFLRAIRALGELLREAPPVLVQCRAGRSRSVVVVAGYLMQSLGINADAALAQVTVKRESFVLPIMERLLAHVEYPRS
jgi:protein-tyrosine phosphatase